MDYSMLLYVHLCNVDKIKYKTIEKDFFGLDREIQRALVGEPARVFFKLNSLTDREVIDKIAEASCAGVRVDMIIRGISCLKPGVPGKTENVHVRSIVGRFLEHARVYAFGVD